MGVVPGTRIVTTPWYTPCERPEPLAVTLTVPPVPADAVNHPLPLKIVAVAPTVAPVGTPANWMVCDTGTGPFNAWVKVSDTGLTVTLAEATVSVTGIFCAGTFGDVLETAMVP